MYSPPCFSELNKRILGVDNLARKTQMAKQYLAKVPPEIQHAIYILSGVAEDYKKEDQHDLTEEDKRMYSLAHYQLSMLLSSEESIPAEDEALCARIVDLLQISVQLCDIQGQPNYMLAKIFFLRLGLCQDGNAKTPLIADINKHLQQSLECNPQNTGSLLLQEYMENIDKPREEIRKHIDEYIEKQDKDLQPRLSYYRAKLAAKGLLGTEYTEKAREMFAQAETGLQAEDYRKGKAKMYIGLLAFQDSKFSTAAKSLLQAIQRYASAATKETYTVLFRICLKSRKKPEDISPNVEKELRIEGKSEPEIEDYFRKFRVNIEQAKIDEDNPPAQTRETGRETLYNNVAAINEVLREHGSNKSAAIILFALQAKIDAEDELLKAVKLYLQCVQVSDKDLAANLLLIYFHLSKVKTEPLTGDLADIRKSITDKKFPEAREAIEAQLSRAFKHAETNDERMVSDNLRALAGLDRELSEAEVEDLFNRGRYQAAEALCDEAILKHLDIGVKLQPLKDNLQEKRAEEDQLQDGCRDPLMNNFFGRCRGCNCCSGEGISALHCTAGLQEKFAGEAGGRSRAAGRLQGPLGG